MTVAEELIELLEKPDRDHSRCRELIAQIGGGTKVVTDKDGFVTTVLHEAVRFGHYDLALEIIKEPDADLDVDPGGWGCVMWDLQYLNSQNQDERIAESKNKLKLVRALIEAGADPNPMGDGSEDLMAWMDYSLHYGGGDYHLWQMLHILKAHSIGITERFFEKIKSCSVKSIILPDFAFSMIDEDMCDGDCAIFTFEDGERMCLSSYQSGDDEWRFYSTAVREAWEPDPQYFHTILPISGNIELIASYCTKTSTPAQLLDLSIDDAVLRITADEPYITVGLVDADDATEERQRKKLFKNS